MPLMAMRAMTHIIIFITVMLIIVYVFVIIISPSAYITCPADSLGDGDGVLRSIQPFGAINFGPHKKNILITSPQSGK